MSNQVSPEDAERYKLHPRRLDHLDKASPSAEEPINRSHDSGPKLLSEDNTSPTNTPPSISCIVASDSAPKILLKQLSKGGSFNSKIRTVEQRWDELLVEVGVRDAQLSQSDEDTNLTMGDRVSYYVENVLAAKPVMKLVWLGMFTFAIMVGLSVLWNLVNNRCITNNGPDSCGGLGSLSPSSGDAYFLAWMFIAAGGGADDVSNDSLERVVISLMILAGMFTFAVLVGFITDGITQKMTDLSSGMTRVTESGHTLLLGWNGSTLRLVKQICLAREEFALQHPQWKRNLCPWRNSESSNKIGKGRIVILCMSHSKEEMDNRIRAVMEEANINNKVNQLGIDIVCRLGNPGNMHDLLRVGANRASVIAVMTTEADKLQQDGSTTSGVIYNGVTIRALLAIRQIQAKAYADNTHKGCEPCHVVAQLSSPSDYVSACTWVNHRGQPMVHPLFIKDKLNALLFTCAVQNGLSEVLLDMLGFDSAELRTCKPLGKSNPGLVGATFKQAVFFFENAVVVGVMREEAGEGGVPHSVMYLNPYGSDVLKANESLIVLSDSSDITACSPSSLEEKWEYIKEEVDNVKALTANSKTKLAIATAANECQEVVQPVHILVCGWRSEWVPEDDRFIQGVCTEVSNQSAPGSSVTFLTFLKPERFKDMFEGGGPNKDIDRDFKHLDYDMANPFKFHNTRTAECFAHLPITEFSAHDGTLMVRHVCGDAGRLETLEPVMRLGGFNIVVVLGTQVGIEMTSELKDSRVLALLLLLRRVKKDIGGQSIHVIGEIDDDETGRLAAIPDPENLNCKKPPDFVNANTMVARFIAQVLADHNMDQLWSELLSSNGSEIYIRGVKAYISGAMLGRSLPFWKVQAAVFERQHPGGSKGHICLGYKDAEGVLKLAVDADTAVVLTGEEKLVIMGS